jgi:hypothetical protein
MTKLYLILLLTLLVREGYSQDDLLLFKKGRRTIASYPKGSLITFQLSGKQWIQGRITRITQDSVYISQEIVHYGYQNDTLHYSGFDYAFTDIYAMPKPGLQIDYIDERFQINRGAGHMHFYWIKSGWLFRVGAATYAAADVVNGLIRNDFSFKNEKTSLGIAAGVFLFGCILKWTYKITYRMGKKYHFESLRLH